jgi:hypothetical protein
MQVQLTEEQAQALKALAQERNMSMAVLIRQSVDAMLKTNSVDREELKRRALSIVGKYRSDISNLGVNHDKYLAEAYAE